MSVSEASSQASVLSYKGFRVEDMNPEMSLFIPKVFTNYREKDIAHVFEWLKIGRVSQVDLTPKLGGGNRPYNAAYVYFSEWFHTKEALRLQSIIKDSDRDARIEYDDPWYWKVLENRFSRSNFRNARGTQPRFLSEEETSRGGDEEMSALTVDTSFSPPTSYFSQSPYAPFGGLHFSQSPFSFFHGVHVYSPVHVYSLCSDICTPIPSRHVLNASSPEFVPQRGTMISHQVGVSAFSVKDTSASI